MIITNNIFITKAEPTACPAVTVSGVIGMFRKIIKNDKIYSPKNKGVFA